MRNEKNDNEDNVSEIEELVEFMKENYFLIFICLSLFLLAVSFFFNPKF